MAHDRSDLEGAVLPDLNPDPITGAAGSHPAGTAIGAASGAASGAAWGAVGGPIGMAIGLVSGAIVGGLIGKRLGEWIDPTDDAAYWKSAHLSRPYYRTVHDFERDLAPAYRLGACFASQINALEQDAPEPKRFQRIHPAQERRSFAAHEDDVRAAWEIARRESRLTYDEARPAIHDAYHRRLYSGEVPGRPHL